MLKHVDMPHRFGGLVCTWHAAARLYDDGWWLYAKLVESMNGQDPQWIRVRHLWDSEIEEVKEHDETGAV